MGILRLIITFSYYYLLVSAIIWNCVKCVAQEVLPSKVGINSRVTVIVVNFTFHRYMNFTLFDVVILNIIIWKNGGTSKRIATGFLHSAVMQIKNGFSKLFLCHWFQTPVLSNLSLKANFTNFEAIFSFNFTLSLILSPSYLFLFILHLTPYLNITNDIDIFTQYIWTTIYTKSNSLSCYIIFILVLHFQFWIHADLTMHS